MCRTCGDAGYVTVTAADVTRDLQAFHTAPATILQAVRDAAPAPARIPCPDCTGET